MVSAVLISLSCAPSVAIWRLRHEPPPWLARCRLRASVHRDGLPGLNLEVGLPSRKTGRFHTEVVRPYGYAAK